MTEMKTGQPSVRKELKKGLTLARMPSYRFLYLKNGKVVSTDWGYLVDKDNEIKPGAMEMGEETGYEDFSEFQVYIHGTID